MNDSPPDCAKATLEILVTQVLVYQAQGSTSRAFESLERALTLAQPEGYVRIFVDEGDPMRSLLLDFRKLSAKQLRGNDHELTSYVDKLLSSFAKPKNMQQAKLVEPLSDRELEVLRLLRTELNGPEIASQLSVSLSTLRTHTQSIFSKLGVNNRRAAVRRAEELGL